MSLLVVAVLAFAVAALILLAGEIIYRAWRRAEGIDRYDDA